MRKKRSTLMTEDEPKFEISSLVDVSFLLLIYFLVVNTIMPSEKDLPMTLPSTQRGGPEDTISLQLEVKNDGSIVMNAGGEDELLDSAGAERDIPITRDRLHILSNMARANGAAISVNMKVAEEASHQRFIDVINCLRGENINSLSLVEPDEQL